MGFLLGSIMASKRGAWYAFGGRRLNKKVEKIAPGVILGAGAIHSGVAICVIVTVKKNINSD